MTHRKNNLFKLPNDIFGAGLNASEITVLAALYSLKSRSVYKFRKYIKISQKALATICSFKSAATVGRAVDKLCRLGYIERVDRYYDDCKKLGTYVYTIPVVKGRNFFFVSREIFKYKLSTAQMRMYLFFCKCAESHSKRFWNSYNDICLQLNLSRSGVIKTISELISLGLVKKYMIRKKNGSYSDNHYKVIRLKPPKRRIKGKKRRCCFTPTSSKKTFASIYEFNIRIIYIIKKVNTFHKYFFYLRGSPKILGSLYSTHFYTIRRKKKIRLYLKYRCNLTIYE